MEETRHLLFWDLHRLHCGNPVKIKFDAGCDKLRDVVISQGWEHHYALSYGDIVPELLDICRILDIEPVVVQ